MATLIECDADGCHGDEGELLLICNLRSGEAKFQLDDYERIAEHAQAALDAHDTRKRIWAMATLHIELWKRVTNFLGA